MNTFLDIGKMKYSFVLPYYDRLSQLGNTFDSFEKFYSKRNDFEVIIVEDQKNTHKMSLDLFLLIDEFLNSFNIIYYRSEVKNTVCPVVAYNEGSKLANGKYLVITNPECQHDTDVLSGFDEEFEKNENYYIVCACRAIDKHGRPYRWFQHTKERNLKYHFCSALLKDNYKQMGGFNEEYVNGYCYDDNSFRDRIKQFGLQFVTRDDLVVNHLWHKKARPKNYKELLERNKRIYNMEFKKA